MGTTCRSYGEKELQNSLLSASGMEWSASSSDVKECREKSQRKSPRTMNRLSGWVDDWHWEVGGDRKRPKERGGLWTYVTEWKLGKTETGTDTIVQNWIHFDVQLAATDAALSMQLTGIWVCTLHWIVCFNLFTVLIIHWLGLLFYFIRYVVCLSSTKGDCSSTAFSHP